MRAVFFVDRFKSRCQVHGVADDGITFGILRSDAADGDIAGGNSHPHIDPREILPKPHDIREQLPEGVQLLVRLQRGQAGKRRMFGAIGKWRSPKSHDGIANVLVDDAAKLPNRLRHQRKILIKQFHNAIRRQSLPKRSETLQIGEEDGHQSSFTTLGKALILQDPLDDARVHILSKGLFDHLFLLKLTHHVVEGFRQHRDLIGAGDVDMDIQIPSFHFSGTAEQPLDGPHQVAGDQRSKQQTQHAGADRDAPIYPDRV